MGICQSRSQTGWTSSVPDWNTRSSASPELSSIPTDLSNYGEIAKVAIQHHGHALKWVPTDRADYGELAKLALQKKYRNAQGDEDVKHMKKMLSWTYVLYAIGESDRARRSGCACATPRAARC